jgi:hypothetical protein
MYLINTKYQATRDERYKSPPVEEVVERLAECRPTSLELFRSRRDKEQLLRAALARPNWDITVTVYNIRL